MKLEEGRLPPKISVFEASDVNFGQTLDLRGCELLCFVIVGQANFIFGEMKMLMYLKISGGIIEGDNLKIYMEHLRDSEVKDMCLMAAETKEQAIEVELQIEQFQQ